MGLLTVADAARTGIDMTGAAAAAGDHFPNTGKEVLFVTNGDSGSHSVTVAVQKQVDGQAATPRTVAVAAGKTFAVGPFPTDDYNDADGFVQLSYSATTSVTVKVLKTAPKA